MEIKEELKKDEELLVKVFKLEKLVKKYKIHLIIIAILIIGYVIANTIYSYIKTQNLIKTNNAFEKLLNNPNDKKALNELKENKELFELYLLRSNDIDKLKEITTLELKPIANYKIAMLKGDKASLESYLLNPEYKILKDPIRLALIKIYLKENNRKKAKDLFSQITPNTEYETLARFLLHYGIVK